MTPLRVAAPAKLNLGLEVVGRRADGYHDLVTIFQAVDLVDDLQATATPRPGVRCGLSGLPDDENLAVRALSEILDATGFGADLVIAKRIPAAAGLGGASSDAAAALRLGAALLDQPEDAVLDSLALGLGSDVPFFLRCGTALATGRGEVLTGLSPLADVWFVVLAPRVVLPRKTPTLFSLLTPGDFSDGQRVRDHAGRIATTDQVDPAALGNAFARPLAALRPDLGAWCNRMLALGAPNAALSGAGPAHYSVVGDPDRAAWLADRFTDACGDDADVFVCRPVPHPPPIVMAYL